MMKYLTKKDLSLRLYGLEQYIPGSPGTKDLVIKVSSGTTGTPTVLITNFYPGIAMKHGSVFFDYFWKLQESYLMLWHKNCTSLMHLNMALNKNSTIKHILCLDKKDLKNPYIKDVLAAVRPTDIFSTPSYITLFLNSLSQDAQKNILENVRYLFLSMEFIFESMIKIWKKMAPHAQFRSDYGNSESNMISYWCSSFAQDYMVKGLTPNVFHVIPELPFNIQIVDQDNKGVGEIVISTPYLPKFRTGDLGELIHRKCSCGATRSIVVHGRKNYDVIHCVGATILLVELEKLFKSLDECVSDYLVEVREVEKGRKTVGELTCKIVQNPKCKMDEPLLNDIIVQALYARLFVTQTRTVGELIEQGIFAPTKVHIVSNLPWGYKKIRLEKIFEE